MKCILISDAVEHYKKYYPDIEVKKLAFDLKMLAMTRFDSRSETVIKSFDAGGLQYMNDALNVRFNNSIKDFSPIDRVECDVMLDQMNDRIDELELWKQYGESKDGRD